jgi:hypothetical protein
VKQGMKRSTSTMQGKNQKSRIKNQKYIFLSFLHYFLGLNLIKGDKTGHEDLKT